MQNRRRAYFGTLVLPPEAAEGTPLRAGHYSPKAFIRECRRFKGEWPESVCYLWLRAFRAEGESIDLPVLKRLLKDRRLADIGPNERELLHLLGEAVCWRCVQNFDALAAFRKKAEAPDSPAPLSDDDREELAAVVTINCANLRKQQRVFSEDYLPKDGGYPTGIVLAEALCRIHRYRDAEEELSSYVERRRRSSAALPDDFVQFLAEHCSASLANAAWRSIARVASGKVEEGLAELFRLAFAEHPSEKGEEAKIALIIMLFLTDKPPYGDAAAWRAAEDAALALEPGEAPKPNRELVVEVAKTMRGRRRGKAGCRKDKSGRPLWTPEQVHVYCRLEARRFLRMRRLLEANDADRIIAEACGGDGFGGILERVATAGAYAMRCARGWSEEESARAQKILKENPSGNAWLDNYFRKALRASFAEKGLFRESAAFCAKLRGDMWEQSRAELVLMAAQAVAERFADSSADRESASAVEALIAEIEAAAKKDAWKPGEMQGFIERLRAIPCEKRLGAWWYAAACLMRRRDVGEFFTPAQKLGVVQKAVLFNMAAPDRQESRRAILNAFRLALCGSAMAANGRSGKSGEEAKKREPRMEMPLCFAPHWLAALERQAGRIAAVFCGEDHADYAVLEPWDDAEHVWIVSVSIMNDARLARGSFLPQIAPSEIAMKAPRRCLTESGEPAEAPMAFFLAAADLAHRMMAEKGRLTSLAVITRDGEPLFDGFPFIQLSIGDSEGKSVLPASADENGAFVRFSPILALDSAEHIAMRIFGVGPLLEADAENLLCTIDPDRSSLASSPKALVSADKAPAVLDDAAIADELCLADRRIIEEGAPVFAFKRAKNFDAFWPGDPETTLVFFATFLKTKTAADFAVVKVKQVAALEPELRFVLQEAKAGAGVVIRDASGRFVVQSEEALQGF